MSRSRTLITIAVPLWGLMLASCQQRPSVAEVTAACQRGNATITAVEFGETYTSTEPEKVSGVPPNVPIYPVKVTYQLPAVAGAEPQETVDRNVYENVFEELVCD